MRLYCTYFNKNFLTRGLSLHDSLLRHSPDAHLCIVCLDTESAEILDRMALPRARVFTLEDLEAYEPRLLAAKGNRSLLEYFYTLSPVINLFVLDTFPDADVVTYLDADLYFFDDPEPLFRELGTDSVAIIEHRFPRKLMHLAKFGIYNVAWISFRRDESARECLNWWRESCLEWCYDKFDGRRYADQKYLDQWPKLFKGVTVLRHKGANVAPWNLANYRVSLNNGTVFVDDERLIFFHFHRFRRVGNFLYDTNLAPYGAKLSSTMRRAIFEPYIHAILRNTARAEEFSPGITFDLGVRRGNADILVRIKRSVRMLQKIFNRDFIYFRDADGRRSGKKNGTAT